MSGFFHISNGISLLWLTTTAGISLCGRIPPCKHCLASCVACRSDQQFNSALRVQCILVCSGYFEKNEERALKAKEKLGFCLSHSLTLRLRGRRSRLFTLCFILVVLLVPFQGRELYNCGTHIIIILLIKIHIATPLKGEQTGWKVIRV